MRTRLSACLIALIVALLAVAPAGAVTDGYADAGAHPFVGLIVFYDADGNPTHRCTGTLISPTVLLTAGHCTEGADSARVYFDDTVTAESGYPYDGGYVGTPYTYAGYGASFPDTGDIGVVVLKKRVNLGYASLADIGYLDSLATARGQQDTTFTVVGYGLQEIKPTVLAEKTRLQATVQVVNLRSALTDGYNIHHTNAPGTGGGTCFGDSGGPVFAAGTTTIVAVTSFGLNANCVGAGFAYRTDTAAALDFIYSFL